MKHTEVIRRPLVTEKTTIAREQGSVVVFEVACDATKASVSALLFGLGFTGGHFHTNWGNENFRKLVLNAILWLAKMEVPADGVKSSVSAADLEINLDPKPAKKTPGTEKEKKEK